METTYNVFTLPNGLRCVHCRRPGLVSHIGVVINAGSRDERPDEYGMAHFVEHTIFKGTRTRRSWHINNRMESVGGELNAYTSKEETLVYTIAPAGYAARALELLADLVTNSVFPQAEIDKERYVINEEINSYLDNPSECVFDEFEERLYAGSGVAHNILGTPESISRFRSADCRAFLDRHYTPRNMVVYCLDPSPESAIERLVAKHFGKLEFPEATADRPVPPCVEPFDLVDDRNGHQAHTIVGTRLFGRNDPRRFALFLLSNHLGGPGMNSVLSQQLRDKHGYVYEVDSMVALLSNCGMLEIYFGSDFKHVDKCRRLINNVLADMADHRLSDHKFEQIRRQYLGQLLVSADHANHFAMALGKNLMYFGKPYDVSWTADRIREVTPEDVRAVAELIRPDCLSRLTIH